MPAFDRLRPLPIVIEPTRRAFDRDWLERDRAVLIDGLTSDWRAIGGWSPEALAARFRDVSLDAYRVERGELVFDARTGLAPDRVSFGELEAEARDGRPTRRVRHRDLDRLPGLADEAPVPAICEGRWRLEPNLWVSPPNTRSQLHFDQPHNLLVQVYGAKRVAVFPASERRNVYPHPPWSAIAQFSRVDVARPDLSAFPRFERAVGYQGTLTPGRALFIPGGHWHYLESAESTISLGFRWWGLRHLPKLVAADLYKRLRGHIR